MLQAAYRQLSDRQIREQDLWPAGVQLSTDLPMEIRHLHRRKPALSHHNIRTYLTPDGTSGVSPITSDRSHEVLMKVAGYSVVSS